MTDVFVKNPILYKGTKAQIESASIGPNDFAVATDVSFYTSQETDNKFSTKEEVNSALGDISTVLTAILGE